MSGVDGSTDTMSRPTRGRQGARRGRRRADGAVRRARRLVAPAADDLHAEAGAGGVGDGRADVAEPEHAERERRQPAVVAGRRRADRPLGARLFAPQLVAVARGAARAASCTPPCRVRSGPQAASACSRAATTPWQLVAAGEGALEPRQIGQESTSGPQIAGSPNRASHFWSTDAVVAHTSVAMPASDASTASASRSRRCARRPRRWAAPWATGAVAATMGRDDRAARPPRRWPRIRVASCEGSQLAVKIDLECGD